METNVKIRKVNEAYIKIDCSESIKQEISDRFTFFVEGAQFSPKFKNKVWDGKIRLFSKQQSTLYFGLVYDVIKFCKENDYTFSLSPELDLLNFIPKENVESFVKELNIHSKEEKIEPFDYQILGIYHALKFKRCILLSATNSGKSLIIYCIIRYLQKIYNKKKILLVVPTTQLVDQMVDDFDDYSSEINWDAEKNCHKIYSGEDKQSSKPITVSTWQSIHKLPESYFEQFDCIIGDEVHKFTSECTKGVVEKCSNADYRIGMTGTLQDMKTSIMSLTGAFGPVKNIVSQKELIDTGISSQLKIKCVKLSSDNSEVNKAVCEMTYPKEVKYLESLPKRLKFICELAMIQPRNTLILFNSIDYGKAIAEYLEKNNSKNKKIFYVDGTVKGIQREAIKKAIEAGDECIFVASYGTTSTGINIKNLNTLILANFSKSKIRILQSIGRLLRKGKDTNVTVYDIADDFSYKNKINYSLEHLQDRIRHYVKEQFDYKILAMKIYD